MKISPTPIPAILGLAAVAASCAILAGRTEGNGSVYLVGVAGGG